MLFAVIRRICRAVPATKRAPPGNGDENSRRRHMPAVYQLYEVHPNPVYPVIAFLALVSLVSHALFGLCQAPASGTIVRLSDAKPPLNPELGPGREGTLMKALILAGGTGTRLRPFTYTMPKQLIPVANKPVLEHVLDSVRQLGVTEAAIIVNDWAPEIAAELGDGARFGLRLKYIPQDKPRGLAHAGKLTHGWRWLFNCGSDATVEFLRPKISILQTYANSLRCPA